MTKLFHLSFLPTSVDLGLLLLRLQVGGALLYLHGWGKVVGFQAKLAQFQSPFPWLPNQAGFGMMVFAEAVCAALIVLGLFTRLAALIVAINMAVAFFVVHKAVLAGPGSGETRWSAGCGPRSGAPLPRSPGAAASNGARGRWCS